MKIEKNKSIFSVQFKKIGGDSWGRPDPIIVVASDFSHANELAKEYFALQQSEKPVLNKDDDNSLVKQDIYVSDEIKLISDLVIY